MTILLARIGLIILAGLLGAQQAAVTETITPVLLEVRDAPVAFAWSDGKTHLVYELRRTIFSCGNATIEQVVVIGDAGAGLKSMDSSEAPRMVLERTWATPRTVLTACSSGRVTWTSMFCTAREGALATTAMRGKVTSG